MHTSDPWVDASTPSLEVYLKETADGQGVVYRLRDRPPGYVAYVLLDDCAHMAEVAFASPRDAQHWADHELHPEPCERAVGG